MDEYNRVRDKAVEDKDRTEDDIIDCNVVDCPEMINLKKSVDRTIVLQVFDNI